MTRLKPEPIATRTCPDCQSPLQFRRILWQGIHVCAVEACAQCGVEFASDLPFGQAHFSPYQVNLKTGALHGPEDSAAWFGRPLAEALMHPSEDGPALEQTATPAKKRARVLMCLDHVYGHALLKLFNAAAELDKRAPDEALIVIVQPALRWLVPAEVDAVWTVKLPFGEAAQKYYPALDTALNHALASYETVMLCPAWSHPHPVDIARFTGVTPHDFAREDFRLTYIWRGSRGWADRGMVQWAGKKLGMSGLSVRSERQHVVDLFEALRENMPKARFTVAGLGKEEVFTAWIDDQRMEKPTDEAERRSCQVYAESRVVFGPHGSNMLLPTAHAGMALILMSPERWGNLAQDTAMHGADLHDPRIAAWRYRYLPDETSPGTVAAIATQMVTHYPMASLQYQAAQLAAAGQPLGTDGLTAQKLHSELLPKLKPQPR